MPENPKSKTVNPWVCVADGIYKNTVSGIYYERPWVGGRRTFRSLRTDSLKLAREVYHHRRTKVVEASIGKADDPYARQRLLTTGQVIQNYVDAGYPDRRKQPRAEGTRKIEESNCKTLMLYWQNIPVKGIDDPACDLYYAWRKKRVKKGLGNRTVDMDLTTLGNALRYAKRCGLITSNPLVDRVRYTAENTVAHCREFMPDDAADLHAIAGMLFQEVRGEVLGWQLLVEACTGLRTSEVLLLRTNAGAYEPGWITKDGKSLWVRRGKGQEAVNPCVIINEGLKAVLEAHGRWKAEHYPKSPWFFSSPKKSGAPVEKGGLAHALRRLRKMGKLKKKVSSHGLRAWYVTVRRSHGIQDSQIAYEIGHTSGGRTLAKVYGGAPPHWLTGDGPKMPWLPENDPAWTVLEKKIKPEAQ